MKSFLNTFTSRRFIIISCLSFIIVAIVGLFLGSVWITPKNVIVALFNPNTPNGRIIYNVRIPRVIATLIAGMALAISGTIIQAILHNPLASPNIIGVNSGALFGIVFFSAIIPGLTGIKAIIPSFLGGLLAGFIIMLLSKKVGASKITLVLAGIAFNSLFQALVDLIIELKPDVLPYSQAFRVGSASGITLQMIWPFIIIVIIGFILALLLSKGLDIYRLGDDIALSLGLNVKLYRALALALACVLASSAVSYMGLISFIGLIVPHIVSFFCKEKMINKIIGSAFFGGFFLTICDILSRLLFSPNEMPVGIILSFIGAPFFLILLIGRRGYD